MKITTLWRQETDDGAMPWMVESYDEYTAEEHGGVPEFYRAERRHGDRELVIEIPEKAVLALFEAAQPVTGKVLT